jgi:hypothetical protein
MLDYPPHQHHQAVKEALAVNAPFTTLVNGQPSFAIAATLASIALRAQSQCRATWETLATIKNPPMMGYVKQANIAHGPQQVNNATAPGSQASRARENPNLQNKLLEEKDGERLDTGATGTAGKADPAMATVGAIDRTKDANR